MRQGQRCPRVAANQLTSQNGPFMQLSPCLTQNRCMLRDLIAKYVEPRGRIYPTRGPLSSPLPYISHCVIFIILFRIPTDGRESSPQDDSEMGGSVTGSQAATNTTLMNTGFKGKKHRQNKNKKQQLSETTSDLMFKLDI